MSHPAWPPLSQAPVRFPATERQWLLKRPRIGPTVVDRLEQVGFGSLAHLRAAGADAVVEAVCRHLGSQVWGNRRRALARALLPAIEASADHPARWVGD